MSTRKRGLGGKKGPDVCFIPSLADGCCIRMMMGLIRTAPSCHAPAGWLQQQQHPQAASSSTARSPSAHPCPRARTCVAGACAAKGHLLLYLPGSHCRGREIGLGFGASCSDVMVGIGGLVAGGTTPHVGWGQI